MLRTLSANVEFDDLVQAGMIGAHTALPRFDPERGVPLNTFIGTRIKGAMLDELRRQDWLTRTGRSKAENTGFHMASLDEMIENDQNPDSPSSELTDDVYERKQRIQHLVKEFEHLTERERDVLESIYVHDMDQAEIAAKYGFSRSRVSQIHRGAIDRLNVRMKASGY